jgi:hypothetical protein
LHIITKLGNALESSIHIGDEFVAANDEKVFNSIENLYFETIISVNIDYILL